MRKFIDLLKSRIETVLDFLGFLWEKKLWWLIPMIIVLLLFGGLILVSQSSVVAPFIYTLF